MADQSPPSLLQLAMAETLDSTQFKQLPGYFRHELIVKASINLKKQLPVIAKESRHCNPIHQLILDGIAWDLNDIIKCNEILTCGCDGRGTGLSSQ